jgi:hypothetical protein
MGPTLTRVGIYDAVFTALHDADVRYVVVGGVAVVLQGHARTTVDLDLVVGLSTENLTDAVTALTGLGLEPRLPVRASEFIDPDVRGRWIAERNLQVFSFYDPGNPLVEVDVFATEPIPVETLLADATTVEIGGVSVPVASRRQLIAMKRQAGRPQDLADIAALEEIERG